MLTIQEVEQQLTGRLTDLRAATHYGANAPLEYEAPVLIQQLARKYWARVAKGNQNFHPRHSRKIESYCLDLLAHSYYLDGRIDFDPTDTEARYAPGRIGKAIQQAVPFVDLLRPVPGHAQNVTASSSILDAPKGPSWKPLVLAAKRMADIAGDPHHPEIH